MPSQKPKVTFYIDEDLLEKVDDFRYDNHFPSRASAVMWLLRYALSKRPKPRLKKKEDY
ncbi:MAG: hypothetical protein ABFD04_11680 [Syntrophomonas sp.]